MQLRPLQKEALEPLRERWVHGDPPGSGKTPVGCCWLDHLNVRRALITAPSNVVRHWGRLGPEWYPGLQTVVVPKGSKPAERAAARVEFERLAADGPAAYITSYALFREDSAAILQTKWEAAIFDESHRLKGRTTILHKEATKLAHRTPYIDLSTGSAILNDAEESWSYLHLMYPKRYRSFWRWAGEHFEIEQTDFRGRLARPITRIIAPKPGALEAIAADFGKSLVARPEEVMLPHLPTPEWMTYEIDLTPAERRIYDGIVRHGWAKEGEELLQASNHLAKRTRLRQLSSDWSAALAEVGEAGSKVQAVAELAADLDQPLLVFVSFKQSAQALIDRLAADRSHPVVGVRFTGDDDDDAREQALADFRSGRAQVLVGTYGALAEGTDGLQHVAHHVALLDHDQAPEIERQAVRRLLRDGQTRRVVVHDFIAPNTIDEEIVVDMHPEKEHVADVILSRTGG